MAAYRKAISTSVAPALTFAGHLGMAREVAAILRHKLEDPIRLDLLPEGPPAMNRPGDLQRNNAWVLPN